MNIVDRDELNTLYESIIVEKEDDEREGLYVYVSKKEFSSITKIISLNDYYFNANDDEHYLFFPEKESNYDALERELSEIFNRYGINARFEGA